MLIKYVFQNEPRNYKHLLKQQRKLHLFLRKKLPKNSFIALKQNTITRDIPFKKTLKSILRKEYITIQEQQEKPLFRCHCAQDAMNPHAILLSA